MTHRIHYPDMFKTINIPQPEPIIATGALHLFAAVYDPEQWNPDVHLRLQRYTESENASQLFWEYDDSDKHIYSRLAINAMQHGLVIAAEYQDFNNRNNSKRMSVAIASGKATVFETNLATNGRIDNGTNSPESLSAFTQHFFDTTAQLGLYHYLRSKQDYSESSAANFASAA